MQSLYLLIPISLAFVAIAIGIFYWAVKSGQYDDLEREGERILFDDDVNDVAVQPKIQKHSEK